MAKPAVSVGSTDEVATSGAGTRRLGQYGTRWSMFVVLAAATALFAVHASVYGHWLIDDSAITFAYARNIANEATPAFQPGTPPVEGYSNPTWLVLILVGELAGLFDRGTIWGIPDYVAYPKALALLCCAGIVGNYYAAAKLLFRRAQLVTFTAAAALAAIPSFVIWAFSGLENSLYGLLIVALAVIMLRAVTQERLMSSRVAVLTGLMAALSALTRPDGIIYVAAYPIVVALFASRTRTTPRRAALAVVFSCAACLIPYGAHMGWRYAVFGRLMPNTAVAKGQTLPRFADVERSLELASYLGWLIVLIALVCVLAVLVRPSAVRTGLITVLVPLGLAVLAYCVLEPDWMGHHRFATPVWTLGVLTAVLASASVLSKVDTSRRVVLSSFVALGMVLAGQRMYADAGTFRKAPTVPMCSVADRFGRAFNGYADVLALPTPSLLAPDLGGTGLTSRLALVDLTGLLHPRIASFHAAEDMAGLRDFVFTNVKPSFIHSHGSWSDLTGVTADPRLFRDYYKIWDDPELAPNQDWVRKELIEHPGQLAALRNYSRTKVSRARMAHIDAPLGECGPTLRTGQTLGVDR